MKDKDGSNEVKKTEIYELLLQILDEDEINRDEPMKHHTSFKIGGPADFFILPMDMNKLGEIVGLCVTKDIPYYIIGNGSNLLVTDKGYRGVILQISKNMSQVSIKGETVYAQAGVLLSKLSKAIYEESLEGFEFASGIPGTLGGAVYMNAGAYGGEMKDILQSVEVMNKQGEFFTLPKEELELGYRCSVLQKKEYIAIGATLSLKKGDRVSIKNRMDDLTQKRKTKQPLEMPSAGSTFKRPEGHFAGKLIMDSGLCGYSIGGAQVSEKHCGFVVNKGEATFEDVKALMVHIKKVVKDHYDVELEPEVRILGE